MSNNAGGNTGGQGRMGGDKPGSGPGGNCICPKCGKMVPHGAGDSCNEKVCSNCGTRMTKA